MSRAWMPLYIGDYKRDTSHLSTIEHGAYLLLMMHYWECGPLPTDESRLAQIALLPIKRWRPIWRTLCPLFRLAAGNDAEANGKQLLGTCWRHKRIDEELIRAEKVSLKRQIAGFKGGVASRGKNNVERFVHQAIAKQTGGQAQRYTTTSFSEAPRASQQLNSQPPPQAERQEGQREKTPNEYSLAEIDDAIRKRKAAP